MDTYGYLYRSSFSAQYPSERLITSDDDSAGGRQFQIRTILPFGYTYVLVVTTHGSDTIGSFSVTAVGPSSIVFTSITPVTSK